MRYHGNACRDFSATLVCRHLLKRSLAEKFTERRYVLFCSAWNRLPPPPNIQRNVTIVSCHGCSQWWTPLVGLFFPHQSSRTSLRSCFSCTGWRLQKVQIIGDCIQICSPRVQVSSWICTRIPYRRALSGGRCRRSSLQWRLVALETVVVLPYLLAIVVVECALVWVEMCSSVVNVLVQIYMMQLL